jgi:putative peptidoglycan lipid II flippase
VGRIIASAQDGAIALLQYADRINQLPLGVIGIAIGVVLLPELSRALNANDHDEVSKLQNRSLEFALLMTLPAAVGFVVIPDAIVALLYQRGAFTAETTAMTAAALAAYAVGLPAYVLIKVFQPAYFAREDMRTPFYFSIVMMLANVGISLLLFPTLGHVGIAIATAVSAWINFVLLASTLWFRGDYRPHRQTLYRVLMIIVSSVIMGSSLYFGHDMVTDQLATAGFLIRVGIVFGLIGASAVIYFAIIILSGVISRQEMRRMLRRG